MLTKVIKIKLKQMIFALTIISLLFSVVIVANLEMALADEKNKKEQATLITLITDFNNLKQNPFELSKEDKITLKHNNNELKDKTGDEKVQLENAKKELIQNAKNNKIISNNHILDTICTPKLAERFKNLFDPIKNNIPLNGVGGGLVALDVKKCDISENIATIEANVTINLITQITKKDGQKFNHKIECTGFEQYKFVKINGQWFIDDWKIIDPGFDSTKHESKQIDENTDDVVDEFVIDASSNTIDSGIQQSNDFMDDVINYGGKE